MNKEEFQIKINNIYIECVRLLKSIGIRPSNNIKKVSINTRAKKRLGCCKSSRKFGKTEYEIEISFILKDSSDNEIMTVMLHELLHSCKGCMNHGKIWKKYAADVNKYLGYNITSRADYGRLNIDIEKPAYKYEVTCIECGNKIYRSRSCNLTKHTENYRCGKCHGQLKVREL